MSGHRLTGVYAITDAALTPPHRLAAQVEAVLRGGARILQYRDKSTDGERRLREARALRELCEAHGALLLINDDIALATAAGAHGVHLGQQDTALAAAREQLGPDAIIGITCHDSLTLAHTAEAGGADYVAFGALFPSPTKPDAPRASLDLIREARRTLTVPICAIGGIEADNAAAVIAAGANLLAVISGVFAQADPEAATRGIQALFPDD
ncbi:MAG: thiamine phosphate synthase [Chromatiales bacterium]|nr:thiamine phosphate synthase [Chromatiales bacterium]